MVLVVGFFRDMNMEKALEEWNLVQAGVSLGAFRGSLPQFAQFVCPYGPMSGMTVLGPCTIFFLLRA